jgi:NADPH:quinone reductase-like Zn-dependent oxidoreductase
MRIRYPIDPMTRSWISRFRAWVTLALIAAILPLPPMTVLGEESTGSAPVESAVRPGRMKAVTYHEYGSPDVLKLEEIDKPAVAEHEVLVRVHAAAVNPLDWHYMRGLPYVLRLWSGLSAPSRPRLGADFAGTVEAVGAKVSRFMPGHEVFGVKGGAFAEYVTVAEDGALALKPPNLSFEQAAAVPIAAVTALQALRDKGRVRPGQKVLINGASGGVGSFAVQIARSFGAEVTGVCSTRNVELVRSLGASHVIDYTREDFTQGSERYDLILDNVGNHPLSALRHAMTPAGILVIVGGPSNGPILGPLSGALKALLYSPFVSQDFRLILADMNAADLEALNELLQAAKIAPVIGRHYPLSEVPAAIAHVEEGHARGKVVIGVP